MSRWAGFFTPAGPSGEAFETDGEIAAEDLLASRACELLQADSKLQQIFGERIEVMESRAPFDSRMFPRLQVYTSSTTEEQNPTSLDVDQVRIYIGIRFDALDVKPVKLYTGTLASVRRQVAKVLKATKSLKVTLADGSAQPVLAKDLVTGGTTWIWDPLPGDRIAGTVETEWIYRTRVDHASQRIDNLRLALS